MPSRKGCPMKQSSKADLRAEVERLKEENAALKKEIEVLKEQTKPSITALREGETIVITIREGKKEEEET